MYRSHFGSSLKGTQGVPGFRAAMGPLLYLLFLLCCFGGLYHNVCGERSATLCWDSLTFATLLEVPQAVAWCFLLLYFFVLFFASLNFVYLANRSLLTLGAVCDVGAALAGLIKFADSKWRHICWRSRMRCLNASK